VGLLAPILLVLCRFLQGFGAGAEQSGGATLLTETAQIGRRGRLAALVMTGAALGTALGAVAWILVQMLPEDDLMTWGWRLVFGSSLFVTIAAFVIRRRLTESPVFQQLKQSHVVPKTPLRDVFANGRRSVLLVMFMTIGISSQSYTYQVFMASYLKNDVGVDPAFIPKVLLIGAICGGIAAYGFGRLSDRVGRKPVYIGIVICLVLLPIPTFLALNTGSHLLITLVMIIGFILACQGAVGVTMSYFPELFGARYRYAGVTLGREFASVFGGGVAPLICASLITAFSGSWIPVAVYMIAMAVTVLIAALVAPETRNRDLTDTRDALTVRAEEARV
jgi:MFS family permease